MELDLSTTALVNAAGALLFFFAGALVLAVSGRTRRGFLVGGLALGFGITFVVQNLLVQDTSASVGLTTALSFVTSLFGFALAFHLAKDRVPPARSIMAWMTAAVLAVTVGLGVVHSILYDATPLVEWFYWIVFAGLLNGSFSVLLLAGGLAARSAADAGTRRAMVLLSLAFGLWTVKQCVETALPAFPDPPSLALHVADGLWASSGPFVLAGILAFIPRKGDADGPLLRNTVLVMVAVGLAATLHVLIFLDAAGLEDFGASGVARTVGVILLAVAVLRYDLLGVPLPRFAVKRGVLATIALGALFIVAQVAQNFLSAEFGMLMGGIVAGAVLFAANPIQRAFERMGEGSRVKGKATDGREDSFRKALRLALRDRRLTREEEADLHQLAHDLGIPGPRAHALLVEAEQEGRGR